jgi:hypothetical protein
MDRHAASRQTGPNGTCVRAVRPSSQCSPGDTLSSSDVLPCHPGGRGSANEEVDKMAVDVLDPYLSLERQVARRLRCDASHRRVSAVLAEVAAAAIHPKPDGVSQGEVMSGLLEEPVASATRVAVETLIDELDDLVDALTRETLEKLAAEQLVADMGVE